MPGYIINPPVVAPWWLYDGDVGHMTASSTYPSGTAYFMRLWVPVPVVIDRVSLYITTSSGHFDAGIYSGSQAGLTKIFSMGSTVMPAAGYAVVTLATPQSLGAGWYYSGFEVDNSTAAVSFDNGVGISVGTEYSLTNTFPLPATTGALTRSATRRYGPVWLTVGAPAP